MTYSGSYRSWRYSSLDQITRQNASRLKVEWVYQMPTHADGGDHAARG